jgi:hypothetical protein
MRKRIELTFDVKYEPITESEEKQLRIVLNSIISDLTINYLRKQEASEQQQFSSETISHPTNLHP